MFGLEVFLLIFLWSTQAQDVHTEGQHVLSTQAQDVLTPSVDIIRELDKLRALERRMKAMEAEMAELKMMNEDQPKVAFSATLSNLQDGFKFLGPFQNTVTLVYENAFTNIGYAYDPQTEQPKVAFSASLSALEVGSMNIGPYQDQVTLVYQNAFTNIGSAYDPNTGIFTAPVRGVYYFSFVVFNPYNHLTGLSLMKNGQHVVSVSDNPPGLDTEDTASNAASLLLEKGDQARMGPPLQRVPGLLHLDVTEG
uniref:C1q domain-containing protein n=1 Tax=Pygocentrus nattereri TaxID=42514 RepID=A0A3B4DA10_PYGNA